MSVPPRTAPYSTSGPHRNPGSFGTSANYDHSGTPPWTAGPGPAGTSATGTVTNDESDPGEQRFSLSATQVLASMAAAVTAAFLGSRLGVAGTVIGAGLASVVTVVGSAVFGHSLLLTRRQVSKAVRQVRHADERAANAPTAVMSPVSAYGAADDRTTVIPAVTRFDLDQARATAAAGVMHPAARDAEKSSRRSPKTRRRIGTGLLVGVAATAAIFAGSLAAVTVIETVKGSPLSGGDSGLSVLGGNGADSDPGTIPTTAPTTTEMSTVTATVTSPAPTSAAPEPTPSVDETTQPGTPTRTSSSAPTTAPSASSSVGATATSSDGSGSAPATAN